MRITIVGAGKTGVYLLSNLRRKHEIVVIDMRLERVELVRSRFPDVTVIHGDACEPEVLSQAGAAETDLTISVTGDDEDNLVVAMIAKHYGCVRTFARINHPKNDWLFTEDFGVDGAFSAAATMLALVERAIGLGDLVTLLRLHAENVLIEEITITPDATAIGKRLSEIAFPASAHVMAILRPDGRVAIASGDTVLAPGDELLLITEGSEADLGIREVLGVTGAEPLPPQTVQPEPPVS